MILLIKLALIINIALALIFILCNYVVKSNKILPKTKSNFGILFALFYITYILLLGIVLVVGIFLKHNIIYAGLLVFLIIPFIIGANISYKTLKLYSFVQLLVFIMSFSYLLFLM